MDSGLIFEHFWLSIVGPMIGISLGTLCGYPIGRYIRNVRKKHPEEKLNFYLFPWRTILTGLFMINLIPLLPLIYFGLGWKSGIIDIAYFVFLSVVAMNIQISYHIGSNRFAQEVTNSMYRSLVVFAPVLLVFYGQMSSGGLGRYLNNYLQTLEFSKAVITGLVILGVVLVFDLLSGRVQYDQRVYYP